MSPAPDSFCQWLTEQINDIFSRSGHASPFIVWCDPHRVWKDLLAAVREDTDIELWADEVPELQLRERFHAESGDDKRRIIWLPKDRNDITFFKVFEIRADLVWEYSLDKAVLEYGVTLAKIQELGDSLPAFARAQLEKPLSTWLNVTDRDTCDNNCILGMLSGLYSRLVSARKNGLRSEKIGWLFFPPEKIQRVLAILDWCVPRPDVRQILVPLKPRPIDLSRHLDGDRLGSQDITRTNNKHYIFLDSGELVPGAVPGKVCLCLFADSRCCSGIDSRLREDCQQYFAFRNADAVGDGFEDEFSDL